MQTQHADTEAIPRHQDGVKGCSLQNIFAVSEASGSALRRRDPQATMALCLGTHVASSLWKCMLRSDWQAATCARHASHRRLMDVSCLVW